MHERRGMKVSRSRTEYMCVNEKETSLMLSFQVIDQEVVHELKYLGSTVQSNGEFGKNAKRQVQARWSGSRKKSGVICKKE